MIAIETQKQHVKRLFPAAVCRFDELLKPRPYLISARVRESSDRESGLTIHLARASSPAHAWEAAHDLILTPARKIKNKELRAAVRQAYRKMEEAQRTGSLEIEPRAVKRPRGPRYPEHEKLAAKQSEAGLLSEFLDYLREQKLLLSKFHTHSRSCGGREKCGMVDYYSNVAQITPVELIGGFLGISQKKIDREKRRMEAALQKEN